MVNSSEQAAQETEWKPVYHKPEDQERSEKDALSGRVLGSISCCEDYEWGGDLSVSTHSLKEQPPMGKLMVGWRVGEVNDVGEEKRMETKCSIRNVSAFSKA